MKQFFADTITQVLKVFNYKPSNPIDISKVACSQMKKATKRPRRFRLQEISKTDNKRTLSFTAILCKDISSNEFYKYKLNLVIERKFINLKEMEKIWKASAEALQTFCYSYYSRYSNKTSLSYLVEKAIEDSIIAQLIGGPYYNRNVDIISNILQALSKWSNRTYEGRKVPFSFLFDKNNICEGNISKLVAFLNDDACALLTDGITSYISLSTEISYGIVPFFDVEDKNADKVPLVPYRFSGFGNICEGNNVGIILTVQGDFLLIKDKKLLFTKRNGNWYYYNYDAFADTLFNDNDLFDGILTIEDKTKAIKSIYLTCLDVAFSRTGGCLAVCTPKNRQKIIKDIAKDDIHQNNLDNNVTNNDKTIKRHFLEDIIINKRVFYDIERKARQEMLGIDGATIICTNGEIITTGAIIDNTIPKEYLNIADTHGGARTKIAQKLSLNGIAIKISADGYIECYNKMKNIY